MASPAGDKTQLLTFRGVTKRFGGVTALDNVDFDLRYGEIHALLGENGAGKSTLIKVLGGIHIPDSGTIRIAGEPADIRGVADANNYGIRIIHQELCLVPNLSIAENIYLGKEPAGPAGLHRRKMAADAQALITDLGLYEISSVGTLISQLSVAHQQLVEIARALSCQARILVLDEPTSSLSEAETEALFVTLRRLRSQGVGIIYISHRLEEVMRLADRITVLRDGRSMGTQYTHQLNQRELIRWMVGRDIKEHFHRPVSRIGQAALKVHNLSSPTVRGVSFELHYGEILGLAGLIGSGRTELARALFGIDPVRQGQIYVDGQIVSIDCPNEALNNGIVLVPEDRKQQGLVMFQSVGFNLVLPWVRYWISACLPNHRKRSQIIDRAIKDFSIRVADPEQSIDSLSGGNQQKVLVGRWMERRPKVLILDEPTRGVDVGAREEMFAIIGSLVESDMAVLFISSDLSEVLHTCHRVALYHEGRIVSTFRAEDITEEQIMEQLTGAKAGENL
ncbi:MAG TPA: sugar ABC transporter ATP-binding protein [Sedimentisphaerales bacterium]|nr:sugar ABC transporter ATP-binding protein [Sedimentisphaerales bacterium]